MTNRVLPVVLTWIERVVPAEDAFGPDTPLLAYAAVDSLAIAELIEALERALGVELAADLIVPASFATPRTLAAAFLASGAGEAGLPVDPALGAA